MSTQELSRHHGASYRYRQIDRAKEHLRIEIVVAGLVDDPQQALLLGARIPQADIDFALLKRGGIAVVMNANHQSLRSCSHLNSTVDRFLSWHYVLFLFYWIAQMNKSARNEMRKLIATWFNVISAAFMTAGIIAPGLTLLFQPSYQRPSIDLVLAIFGICALLSGTIHLVAQSHLYGFEE
jgi:hypothetical protein